jgi:hypothetical protein
MTVPVDPELHNAVSNIIALLTALELGEEEAVNSILGHPLPVLEVHSYISATVVICQHLVREVVIAADVDPVVVLRQLGEAFGG